MCAPGDGGDPSSRALPLPLLDTPLPPLQHGPRHSPGAAAAALVRDKAWTRRIMTADESGGGRCGRRQVEGSGGARRLQGLMADASGSRTNEAPKRGSLFTNKLFGRSLFSRAGAHAARRGAYNPLHRAARLFLFHSHHLSHRRTAAAACLLFLLPPSAQCASPWQPSPPPVRLKTRVSNTGSYASAGHHLRCQRWRRAWPAPHHLTLAFPTIALPTLQHLTPLPTPSCSRRRLPSPPPLPPPTASGASARTPRCALPPPPPPPLSRLKSRPPTTVGAHLPPLPTMIQPLSSTGQQTAILS